MIKIYIFATAFAFLITGCASTIKKGKENYLINRIEYTCENGKKLNVLYFTTGEYAHYTRIQLEHTEYILESVPSASGAKYSDGKYTWWTKGFSGFLKIDNVITLRDCVSQGQR